MLARTALARLYRILKTRLCEIGWLHHFFTPISLKAGAAFNLEEYYESLGFLSLQRNDVLVVRRHPKYHVFNPPLQRNGVLVFNFII